MSTHNIGFYEELTKIIFELSSNIIKYAPYFFFCQFASDQIGNPKDRFSHDSANMLFPLTTRKQTCKTKSGETRAAS